MAADLNALRRQWQACIVQARVAVAALRAAETAYVAAHRVAHPPRDPMPDALVRSEIAPRVRRPASPVAYPGA